MNYIFLILINTTFIVIKVSFPETNTLQCSAHVCNVNTR